MPLSGVILLQVSLESNSIKAFFTDIESLEGNFLINTFLLFLSTRVKIHAFPCFPITVSASQCPNSNLNSEDLGL